MCKKEVFCVFNDCVEFVKYMQAEATVEYDMSIIVKNEKI